MTTRQLHLTLCRHLVSTLWSACRSLGFPSKAQATPNVYLNQLSDQEQRHVERFWVVSQARLLRELARLGFGCTLPESMTVNQPIVGHAACLSSQLT